MTFLSFLTNTHIWEKPNQEYFFYYSQRSEFHLKISDENEIIEGVNEKLNKLMKEDRCFDPFFNSNLTQNPLFFLLILFQFSPERKEKNIPPFRAPPEFFQLNHENNLIRYVFGDPHKSFSKMCYSECRNFRVLESIRNRSFEKFKTFFIDFENREIYICAIAVIIFKSEEQLYQIISDLNDKELSFLRAIFQSDHTLLNKINELVSNKYSEVLKFFNKGNFQFGRAAFRKIVEKKNLNVIIRDTFSDSESD